MAGITISGIASGLDIESIISKLMQVESAPRARMERHQGQVKAREEALRDISAKLQTVSDAAADLRSASLWSDVQTVESTSTAVAARRLSGTGPGGYQVEVSQLARAAQRGYAFTASATASQIEVNGVSVELGAEATLADAVAAINGNAETGVYAVASGGQLILSSRTTGAAQTIAATGATISEDPSKAKAGLDAAFSIDGVAGTSASNVLTEAIPGLELTLKATTTGAATVTVGNPGPDEAAISSQLKSFVSAYNTAVDAIRSRLTDKRILNPGTQAEANHGVLFGDSQLNGLLAQLRGTVSEAGLSALGVSTGAPGSGTSADSDAVIGHLVLDEAKLGAALEGEPASARNLVSSFAETIGEVVGATIGTAGTIPGRLESASAEARRLTDSMTALNTRLEQREEHLRLQFAAMESALLQSQNQSSWLTGQLEQLG
jgi:flagellar hook-associated protein 2